MKFEWNDAKSKANVKKHGVTFDEAKSVFFEDTALLVDDPDHSDDEDRFLLLGPSGERRILVVVHCYRDRDEVIRIISARPATSRESQTYMSQRSSP